MKHSLKVSRLSHVYQVWSSEGKCATHTTEAEIKHITQWMGGDWFEKENTE